MDLSPKRSRHRSSNQIGSPFTHTANQSPIASFQNNIQTSMSRQTSVKHQG